MAHELEVDVRGRASFCYRKANGNPWHRLGHGFDHPPTFVEAVTAARLDRTAYTEDLVTAWSSIPIPDRKAVIWPDLDGEPVYLGTVGSEYPVVQYVDVVELAMAVVGASKDDAILDTLGVLFDGKRMFGFIDFGDVESVLPNGMIDRMVKGLGFMSSHDGSQAITFWLTMIRAVCNNTVGAGISAAKAIVRVRHAGNAGERMAQVPELLGLAYGGDAEFTKLVTALGQVEGPNLLDRVIERLWPQPDPATATARSKALWANRRDRLHLLHEAPSNAGGFGDNGWSAYNTLVEFLDHHQGDDAERRARNTIDPSSHVAARKQLVVEAVMAEAGR